MIIAIDAMGGDYAPQNVIDGVFMAHKANVPVSKYIFFGNENVLRPLLDVFPSSLYEIVHTDECIEMSDHPALAYRQKKNASITLATRAVKEEKAHAVISAGSTGAQLTTAIFELGRIPGVKRPCLAAPIPTLTGKKLLLDCGANTSVTALNIEQFALMGKVYAEISYGIKNPSVGLINNGSEEIKGSDLTKEAFTILNAHPEIQFYGNIEGNQITKGVVDVMVTDGFTGNVILKTLEGTTQDLMYKMKSRFLSRLRYKIGAYLLKEAFLDLKKEMSANEVGGVPLLGVRGLSIVCHGNSDAVAICQAIRSAVLLHQEKLLNRIENMISTA